MVGDAYVGGDVPLGHERVIEMMDQIAAVIRASDPPVWAHTWGGAGFPEALVELVNAKDGPLRKVPAEPGHG